MDRSLIEEYVQGGPRLQAAFKGLSRDELLALPVPGTWSLQQIAIHMLDSDLIGSDRMKRVAAMDKPLLIGFDETAFSRLPGINELDAHQACELFAINRQMTATILRALPEESFARFGVHNEVGKVTLAELIQKNVAHLEGHLAFVVRKRQLLGKPLT